MRKVVFLLVIAVVVIGVGFLSAKRIQQAKASAEAEQPEQPPLPVRAVRAYGGPIRAFLYNDGLARAVKRDFLTFQATGKVVFVKKGPEGRDLKEGDKVIGPSETDAQGELLAQVDPRDLEQEIAAAEASVEQAGQEEIAALSRQRQSEADLRLAVANVKRAKNLYAGKSMPKSEYDQFVTEYRKAKSALAAAMADSKAAPAAIASAQARLTQAQVMLEHSRINAPFDGVLAYLNIREGDYFSPGTIDTSSEEAILNTIPMMVIDPSQFEITMDLPLFEAARIEVGQEAFIFTGVDISSAMKQEGPGEGLLDHYTAKGRIFSVNPAINPGGRSIRIKIRTDEGADRLKDGMFVMCWIVVTEKRDAVIAPFSVFIFRDNRAFVFVVDEKSGVVQEREITAGIEGLAVQEVTDVIKAGELMVTDGRYNLVNGARVEIVEVEGETKK